MGILAPLALVKADARRLVLSTGLGPLVPALLFFFFAATLFAMLVAAGPLLARFAVLLAGFRQRLSIDAAAKTLEIQVSSWGVPLRRRRVALADIEAFELENRVPNRYRPEWNILNKPVGYWILSARLRSEAKPLQLDRAPRREEMEAWRQAVSDYIASLNDQIMAS
jgi:hypothetical protein